MRKLLTKIERNKDLEGGLRTDSVEGTCSEPIEGFLFTLLAKSLNDNLAFRCVSTSIIEKIEDKGDHLLLYTISKSIYKLEDVK